MATRGNRVDGMRRRVEETEDRRLAPYALRSRSAARRLPIEDEGRAFDYRSQFQRDRDRIVYSRAFRRLRQKALAGILPAYEDHRRNRLTHTLEVAQFARTLGRSLELNEDLIEAAALGHDLGQPPFGPSGARALDDLLSGRLDGRGGPGRGELGGFWRGWQGLRVVDSLERRYDHPGLNLTDPVREAIFKGGMEARRPPETIEGVRSESALHLEGQVVGLADRISSALSDLDDALQARAVTLAEVERLEAVRRLREKLGTRYRERAGAFVKANTIHRGLIHLMATAAILASRRSLVRWAERHRLDAHDRYLEIRDDALRGDEIALPPAGRRMLEDLEGFLEGRVHRGHEADRVDGHGRRVILGLFMAYHADPTLLPDHLLLRFKEIADVRYLRDVPRGALETEIARHYRAHAAYFRLLADHLSAMTDAFAIAEHRRLLRMGAVPIPSAEQLRRET